MLGHPSLAFRRRPPNCPRMASVSGYLLFGLKVIGVLIFKFTGFLLSFYPPVFRSLLQKVAEPSGILESGLTIDDLMGEFFTWRSTRTIIGRFYKDSCCRTAVLGGVAPNPPALTMDKTICRLLDFQKPLRPLVVNFGSCT